MKTAFDRLLTLALLCSAALPASLSAQSITLNQQEDANTYVSSGQPAMNFGTMGAMEIAAPTTAQNRTEETLLQFNTAAIQSTFNADYGPGNWTVTSVTLKLFSNVAQAGTQPNNSSFNVIAAGGFELDWLSDNNWSSTTVTWNNLPNLLPGTGNNTLASLGDFNWLANGAPNTTWSLGLDPNLVNDIDGGGAVTIFGQPTAGSTVGYLFNTALVNAAVLNVTATAVPEPSAMALIASGLAGMAAIRRWKNQGERTT
jgi:hypothetical protein